MVLDSLTYAGDLNRISNNLSNPNFTFIKGDIRDRSLISDLINRVDGVINFAAETHVDRSITSPVEFIQTNVMGFANLLALANEYKKRILQISTDEVYGSILEGCASEDQPLNPSSPYSASKAAADLLALSFYKTFGTDIVITRCSNNYGPNQFPEKIIPLFIKILSEGGNVPIYGDGQNRRDWIHVDDHCDGIALAYSHGLAGNIYNIGDNQEFTNLEITKIILNELKLDLDRIDFVEDRKGHDFRYAVDSKKIRDGLGWERKKDFREEISELVNSYKKS